MKYNVHAELVRLLSHVQMTRGCWFWLASKTGGGYGQTWSSRYEKRVDAHRVMWEAWYGPIWDDLIVLHACDQRDCVNPFHLYLGTYRHNTRDIISRGRWGNPGAKLSKSDIVRIRELRNSGLTLEAIANQFGVTVSNVGYVVRGDTWS